LGSDATVAFGYKDLKIRNNLESPIRFRFSIKSNNIIIILMHAGLIETNKVEFKHSKVDNAIVEVVTVINEEIVNKSKYKRHVPNNVYNS
jgi:vancomycin resistance protein VanW